MKNKQHIATKLQYNSGLPLKAKITPILKQWIKLKQKVKDAILLFRMGDFYELFGTDAIKAAPILNLVITSRDKYKNNNSVKMAGFPWHSAKNYIFRLINAGFKVAICEQLEPSKEKNEIVKRDITRIITPGTILEEDGLLPKINNYLVSILINKNLYAISILEISTGEFLGTTCTNQDNLFNELTKIAPSEIVLTFKNIDINRQKILTVKLKKLDVLIQIRKISNNINLFNNFKQLDCWFNEHENKQSLLAAQILLKYIKETQGYIPKHIQPLKPYSINEQLIVDAISRNHLNIGNSKKISTNKGTLINIIDKSKTAMGGRYLRKIILAPSTSIKIIKKRYNIVNAFINDFNARKDIRNILTKIYDLERLVAQCAMSRSSPKHLGYLRETLGKIPDITYKLKSSKLKEINNISNEFNFTNKLFIKLNKSLNANPPLSLKDGNIFCKGFDKHLDKLKDNYNKSIATLSNIEKQECKKTGINNLKIKYNKIFGYYIEVTKSHINKVPNYYIRKQTTINSERFIIEKLNIIETKLINDYKKLQNREKELFIYLCNTIANQSKELVNIASAIAKLDTLLTFAEISYENNYICPKILPKEKNIINIKNARHPMMEILFAEYGNAFIPNDILINNEKNQIILITGPNMGGKSTIMHQVALLQLLAQAGCFIPASEATISICDRIFSRIGASDDLNKGRSTFMVEMSETANILQHATKYSLILLDEIGRGTSTFEGLSIAWAVAIYIHDIMNSRTIFATHYYELAILSSKMSRLKNMHVSALIKNNNINFLYRLMPGSESNSYGIYVAKIAGIPNKVLNIATRFLLDLKNNKNKLKYLINKKISNTINSQINALSLINNNKIDHNEKDAIYNSQETIILEEIKKIDINNKTPLECLNQIINWKQKLNK